MASSISSPQKQDLMKFESTSEVKEEGKPIITPKQESPQEIKSERTDCPNFGVAAVKIEKGMMQTDPPKKEFPSLYAEGGGGVTEMKTTMFSPPTPDNSISCHPSPFSDYTLSYDNHRVPFDSCQGLYFGPNYGGGGSSNTNMKPLFGSGVTRGVTSMFSPPTPGHFFTGSTYFPKPISYGLSNDDKSIGGSNSNNSVGSSFSGEVPRELIDLNKPPCFLVDLYHIPTGIPINSTTKNTPPSLASPQTTNDSLQEDDSSSSKSRSKGKAKMVLEDDDNDKDIGMTSWGTKKKRTR